MRIFVTGTDTDVGKTLVSAWLCRHFGLDYFKPVQAGLQPMTDSEWVKIHAGCHTYPETYRLREPASPHHAARLEAGGSRWTTYTCLSRHGWWWRAPAASWSRWVPNA
ncbi:Dethiobiotin synthase [Advenella kashmirensis WT001]|uniref:Dethiobiotin synthase n=1 Tax=Advenella kashmirensis (strain DSM 17095 / LMG 22695 / WT001) TaxID=1036672 RepID=I3UE45_ADVKW|nr:dethiobiotin synthase [Advenella kashmirensis]AFK63283.1 Dethiobiotin synthase [Advenella kashmirensis WT001]